MNDTPIVDNGKNLSFFIPIEFTHFINVLALKEVTSKGVLILTILTYGKEKTCIINKELFEKYFDGAIIASSPKLVQKNVVDLVPPSLN